jgi:hypothetical protein
MSMNHTGEVKVDALKAKTRATAEVIRQAEDQVIAQMQRKRALDAVNDTSDAALRAKYQMKEN